MKEIKDLNLKDLKQIGLLEKDDFSIELRNAKKMLYVLRMKLSLSELKQTHLIKFVRKYIARLNTIANIRWFNLK